MLERGPWVVNKDIVIVKEWDVTTPIRSISFNTTPIWVHVHGIPPASMSKENIWKIGENAGTVLEVDINEHTKWKPFVRVQLDIMVSRPLFPGFYLPRKEQCPI